MDHPLLNNRNKALRQRVIQLLKDGYNVRRNGNFVFVCGGNNNTDMRTLFREYCKEKHPEFEVFFPEYAMKNYFSSHGSEPFDIADFESLIADLSHAIVLFPEAPGSFAEVGYFSALDSLARKTILALNLNYQGADSFISMGPAKKFEKLSLFSGTMQIDYKNPDFSQIIKRIKRIGLNSKLMAMPDDAYSKLENYQKFCLIHKCFSILRFATIEDITFILRARYMSRVSENDIKQITSILVGSNYLINHGDFGHYGVNAEKDALLKAKLGRATEENNIRLEMLSICGGEFLGTILESEHAA